jgi:ABC-type uncharacterized transport system YnjBCD substrate-binding protein
VSTWADYIATTRQFVQRLRTVDDHGRRRARVSIQFIAEHTLAAENPPGWTEVFQLTLAYYRESLQAIHRNGEITLPLGLRTTAELHQRLETGTIYMMVADKTVDARQATSTLLDAFGFTAGLKSSQKRRRL